LTRSSIAYVIHVGNQWSNYEGARGGLAPWKTGWPLETPGLRG